MIIALHKPYGVLSQFTPEPGSAHQTLAAFDLPPEVYPIGRLDADSEGLLLLTNERQLPSAVLDPENGHERTYLVQVEGAISDQALERLRGGIVIRGYTTLPCAARVVEPPTWLPERIPPVRFRATIPTSWIELDLREGKNRQVRRMTAAIGFPTLRLLRRAIGALRLEDLGIDPGQWRILSDDERRLLTNLTRVANNRERKA